ncbi:MAG: tetratricopeptide repeat protein [Chitinophagales bacterium]
MNIKQAIELINKRSFEEAIFQLNQIIENSPENVEAFYWRSVSFLNLKQFENALYDLDSAIDKYDEYADAYTQRGVVYFHMGKLQLALDDMNKAAELEPKNPYRYSSRAYIKGHFKQLESAIEDYKIAIELDPEDAVAHNNLGLLEEQLGYGSMAQKRFKKADQLSVNNDGKLIETDNTRIEPLAQRELADNETTNNSNINFTTLLKQTFTTKKGFNEYWSFVKGMFK